MKKIAIALFIISFGSTALGFLREVLFAKEFGASVYTDAYVVATLIPSLFFLLLVQALLWLLFLKLLNYILIIWVLIVVI